MNWPTAVAASVIAAVLAAVIITEIKNGKKGKPSCSCGGNCGACGAGCGACKEEPKSK